MNKKELQETRAAVANEMNGMVAERGPDRPFTSEEVERFDKLDNEFKALGEQLETAKRIERANEIALPKDKDKVATSYRQAPITRTEQDMAFKCWALTAAGKEHAIRREHVDAAHKCNVNLNSDRFSVSLSDNPKDIERNQSSSINSEGGYLQNDGLFQALERNMKWFGGARSVAKVIRTDTGEPLSWAYADDTANVGVRLGQNTTVSNTNVVYSKKTLGEFTYTSGVYPVSVQLLQDARIDVSSDIGEALGIRLARITNTDYTSGTGASMPSGFLQDATLGATAAGAAIAYDDLVKLLFSVDKAYRDDSSFAFTMNDSTMSALWQLTDQNLRPLFWNQLANLASGAPLRILDKPVVINNDIPAVATGKKTVVAITGNKFIIRDVKSVEVMVLRERFMDQLAIGFIAYLRTDSKLLNPNTAKYLVMP